MFEASSERQTASLSAARFACSLAMRCVFPLRGSAAAAGRPARLAAACPARGGAPRLHSAAAPRRRGAAVRSGAIWHEVGPQIIGVVDPLVAAATACDNGDDGLGGPTNQAVAQTLWLRRLADEQRELLADRLRAMPPPLAVCGAGVSAGFGGAAASEAAAALQRDGVVILRSLVSAPLCDTLKFDVDARAERARRQLGASLRRVDALLEFEGPARDAALQAAGPGGVAAVLARVPDASADARLVEFSVLSTEPGADRQVLHPDARADASHAPMYSLFVALQDVTPEMGPTCFVPGTHSAESHAAFPAGPLGASARALLRASRPFDAPLRKGDAALYDARVFHAGGRNDPDAGARRGLLTLTFMRGPVPPAPQRRNSGGAAFSIRPEVLRLGLSVAELAAMAQGTQQRAAPRELAGVA